MISVILVNYNNADDTLSCIKSIRESVGVDYRIIVVDNASCDESINTLMRGNINNDFELIEAKENRGFSAGNNIGIKRSLELGTDQILLLNNDTIIEKDTLKKLKDGLYKYPNCGLTIGKIYYESDHKRIWYAGGAFNRRLGKASHWHYMEHDSLTGEKDTEVSFATGCCMCMCAEMVKQVGMLDESYFLYEEDVDYCLRISEAGYKMYYIPEAIIYHKVSASTGKTKGIVGYYTFRNKFKLVKKRLKKNEKITAYGFTIVQGLKECLTGKMRLSVFLKAFDSFIKDESGKTERIIQK